MATHLPSPVPAVRPTDGRNIDPRLGTLSGEEGASYYGLPLLKEPVWRWYIPAYFYAGGVAGAAAALGAATQLFVGGASPAGVRRRVLSGEHRLVRTCRLVATAGAGASAALLVADLGRPARFLNMLRVFRPTSPMNMGTWIITAFGGAAAAATAGHLLPLPPGLRRVADASALAAGIMGLPLCTYTGVLVANTAVPIWQGTRRTLPVLFAASGAAGAASLLELWPPGGRADAVVRRFALIGKGLEVVLSEVLAREAHAVPRVGRPLRRGLSAALWRAAQASTAAGFAASLLSRRGAPTRRVAGALGTLGALCLRFAIMQAGRASARDPHATSAQQRAGRGAADVVTERDQAGASPPALRGPPAAPATGQADLGQHV